MDFKIIDVVSNLIFASFNYFLSYKVFFLCILQVKMATPNFV